MSTALQPGTTLLEASAGTGKTFRIAHTVLRLVAEQDIGIDSIAVVTFTNAATSELRERVRNRLRDALAVLGSGAQPPDEALEAWAKTVAEPGPVLHRLHAALVDFDEASISTLHGFCQAVLRRHAFESGARLDVALVGEVPHLRDDLVIDFWTALGHSADPAIFAPLQAAGMGLDVLHDLAKKAADPDRIVVPDVRHADAPDLSDWIEARTRLAHSWDAKAVLAALEGRMAKRTSPNYAVSFPTKGTKTAADSLIRALHNANPLGAPPNEVAHFGPDRLAAATKAGQTTPSLPCLDAVADYLHAHAALAPSLRAFVVANKRALVDLVRQQLPRRTAALEVRTYDQLLRDLRDALAGDGGAALAAVLRGRFQVALIDEFQDTDPVQWSIFSTVFTEHMVLIGDPKQAIYGFRAADVHTYRKAAESVDHTAALSVNHRSDPRLVHALNHLFSRVVEPFGGPEPAYEPVRPARTQSGLLGDSRPPLHLRWMPRNGAGLWNGFFKRRWLGDALPALVADDIAAELARGTQIATRTGQRALAAADCAVLTRSNAEAAAVQAALQARGLPAVRRSDDPVLDTDLASELRWVMGAMVDPTSGTALRRALATPLLGWTAERIAELESQPEGFVARARQFREAHDTWHERGVHAATSALFDADGTVPRTLGQPGGTRRVADLLHCLEVLHDAEVRERLGPTGLVDWLVAGGGGDPDRLTRRMETDAPAVQVVTMHAAKGLEFNLVWCPYLWWGSGLGKRDKHQLEFHDAQGRAALDLGSSQLEDHLAAVHQERRAEDLRLAYVALTRARHRLVVYWGPATFEPALAWVLHQPPDQAPSGWSSVFRRLRSDTSIEADLQRLAEHDDLEMSRVDWATGPTADDPAPPERLPLSVRVLSRPRGPQRGWRRASYSTLKRGGLPAPGGPPSADHDEATEIGEEEGGDGLVPLAEMRGGTKVGHMLHAVFEHLDFQEPQTLAAAVKVQLHRYGLPADLSDPLVPAMEAVLRTPLQDGFCLADLPRGQRLDELAFTFPVRGGYQGGQGALTAGALAKAIGAELPSHAPALGALPFPPLRGFLTGAIDLVFRHDGRWYLADYKSNFLGRRWSDYTPARLDHAMVHHHYGLQAHLYTVALHRYLSLRVPNYRYDEHFGGCLYLFLRGMAPEHPGHGVWFHRPSPTTLAALERALGAP